MSQSIVRQALEAATVCIRRCEDRPPIAMCNEPLASTQLGPQHGRKYAARLWGYDFS